MQFYLILSCLEIFSGYSPEDILTHPTTASNTYVLVLPSMSHGGRQTCQKYNSRPLILQIHLDIFIPSRFRIFMWWKSHSEDRH